MKPIRGHALQDEGAAFNGEKHPVRVKWNTVSGIGYGLCQCGARSTITDSSNHRREWHKRHKAEVLGSV